MTRVTACQVRSSFVRPFVWALRKVVAEAWIYSLSQVACRGKAPRKRTTHCICSTARLPELPEPLTYRIVPHTYTRRERKSAPMMGAGGSYGGLWCSRHGGIVASAFKSRRRIHIKRTAASATVAAGYGADLFEPALSLRFLDQTRYEVPPCTCG